jgi:dihydropteroate synthase
MSTVPSRDEMAEFERALAEAGPAARLYLRPVALVAGRIAVTMVAGGAAQPIAGGALAMTAGEIHVRAQGRVRRVVVSMPALMRWIAQAGSAAARLRTLLDRIASPRAGTAEPRLMGVVNVTPDSFSDGGLHLDPQAALARCRTLAEDGAGILDIGGESTRPGATPVSPAEEVARVQPVLDGLRDLRSGFPGLQVSIDTRHAEVMRAALAAGADIINDVTALTGDGRSLEIAAAGTSRIVLMHMQGTPETMNLAPAYDDVALDVFDFLEARIETCLAAGIARDRLIVDPGIGFAKRGRENQEILRALTLFHGLGCTVLLGLSRKGLGIAKKSRTPSEREPASLAAAHYALSQGVQILRVHDVAATRQAVELWRRLSAP